MMKSILQKGGLTEVIYLNKNVLKIVFVFFLFTILAISSLIEAVEILGVADRLGSIEAGKDADIVIWKGHPLNTWGETRTVIVDGKIVYERKK